MGGLAGVINDMKLDIAPSFRSAPTSRSHFNRLLRGEAFQREQEPILEAYE